jgi:hypothetical protein
MSLNRAAAAGDAPFVQYQGQRIADLSGNEQMGIQSAASNYGMYQPLVDMASMSSADLATKAGRAPTQGEIGQFINPYVDYVLGNSLDRLQEQSDTNMTKIGSSAAMSGAFGGLRHGVLEGANLAELLKSARDLSGTTYADAYDKGMGNWWKSQDSQRASIDTLLGTARGGQAYNQGDISQLMQTGLTERTRNQGLLDFNFGEFMREQEDPLTKASFMSSIAAQYPRDIFTKTTKSESTTTDSPIKTLAGIGIAAAGIMSGNPAAALSLGAGAASTGTSNPLQAPNRGIVNAKGGLIKGKGYKKGGQIPTPKKKPNENDILKGMSYRDAIHFLDRLYEEPYNSETTSLPYYQGMINWYDNVAKQQALTPEQQKDRDWYIGHRDIAKGYTTKDKDLMNAGYRMRAIYHNPDVTKGDKNDPLFNYSGEEERLLAMREKDRRDYEGKQSAYPYQKNRPRKRFAEGGFLDDIQAWGANRDMDMVKAGLSIAAGADPLEAMDAYKAHQQYLQDGLEGGYDNGGYVHGKAGKTKDELLADKSRSILDLFTQTMDEVDEANLIKTQDERLRKFNQKADGLQQIVKDRRQGVARMRLQGGVPQPTPEGDPNFFKQFEPGNLDPSAEPPPINARDLKNYFTLKAIQDGTYPKKEYEPFIESYSERQALKKKRGYSLGGFLGSNENQGGSPLDNVGGFADRLKGSWFGRLAVEQSRRQRQDPAPVLNTTPRQPFNWEQFQAARAQNGQLTNLTGGMQPRVPMGQRPDLSMYMQAMQSRMQPQQPAMAGGGYVKKYAEGSFVQGGRGFDKSQERVPADDIDPLAALYYNKSRKDYGNITLDPLVGRNDVLELDNEGTTSKAALRKANKTSHTPVFNSLQDVLKAAPELDSVKRLRPDFEPSPFPERSYSNSRMWDGVNEDVFVYGTFDNEQDNRIKNKGLSLNDTTAAFGEQQFMIDTWNGIVPKIPKAVRKSLGIDYVDGDKLRSYRGKSGDPALEKLIPNAKARDYVYRNYYLPDSVNALRKANLPVTEINLYLAHHLGQEGAVKAIPHIYDPENSDRKMSEVLAEAGLKKAAKSKGNHFDKITVANYLKKKSAPYKALRAKFEGRSLEDLILDSQFTSNKGTPHALDSRNFPADSNSPKNYRDEQRALLDAEGPVSNELSPLHGLEKYRKSALSKDNVWGGRRFAEGGPVMRDSLGNIIPESKDDDEQTWYERYLEGVRTPLSKGWGDLNDFFAGQTGVMPTNRGELPTSYPVVQKIAPMPSKADQKVPASLFSGPNFFDSASDDVASFYDELGSMTEADPLTAALEAGDYSAPMAQSVGTALEKDEDEVMLKKMLHDRIVAMNEDKGPQQPTLFGLNVNMDLVKLGLGMLASDKNFGGALGEAGMNLIQSKEQEELRRSKENSTKLQEILDLRYKNAMMESMDPEVKAELARQKHAQDMQLETLKRNAKLEELNISSNNILGRTVILDRLKRINEKIANNQILTQEEKSFLWSLDGQEPQEPMSEDEAIDLN